MAARTPSIHVFLDVLFSLRFPGIPGIHSIIANCLLRKKYWGHLESHAAIKKKKVRLDTDRSCLYKILPFVPVTRHTNPVRSFTPNFFKIHRNSIFPFKRVFPQIVELNSVYTKNYVRVNNVGNARVTMQFRQLPGMHIASSLHHTMFDGLFDSAVFFVTIS
jgi:hypothetical protein